MNLACPVALLAAVSALLGASPPAEASSGGVDSELARCKAVSAPDARLSCYDTLAGRTVDRNAPSVSGVGPAAVLAAPAPAVAPSADSMAASAATPVPAPPMPTQDPQNFGFSGAQHYGPAPKLQVIQSIQAHVSQVPADQLRPTHVELDNGQTWTSTDGGMILDAGEAVTIQRAALGSFLLRSASNHSYHVRRLR